MSNLPVCSCDDGTKNRFLIRHPAVIGIRPDEVPLMQSLTSRHMARSGSQSPKGYRQVCIGSSDRLVTSPPKLLVHTAMRVFSSRRRRFESCRWHHLKILSPQRTIMKVQRGTARVAPFHRSQGLPCLVGAVDQTLAVVLNHNTAKRSRQSS